MTSFSSFLTFFAAMKCLCVKMLWNFPFNIYISNDAIIHVNNILIDPMKLKVEERERGGGSKEKHSLPAPYPKQQQFHSSVH